MSRGFGGVYIDGADFNGQCPVLTHGGVVDVDAEVLTFLCTNRKPVRASLAFSVFHLLDGTDQTDVLNY